MSFKSSCKTTSHLMEEDHCLVTAPPTLSSFHASAGFLVDRAHAWKPRHKPFLGMNEKSDIGLPTWGPQNTTDQETGCRTVDRTGWVLQHGLSPTHGFSSKHSGAIQLLMSAAFRRVEFSNHWLGEDLELGAMGWARGPETQN